MMNNKKLKEALRSSILSDPKAMSQIADNDRKNREQNNRMKYGKFVSRAKDAKDRLRPGEVKRYDKKLNKWVSNKD
jgi:hypothetical protein